MGLSHVVVAATATVAEARAAASSAAAELIVVVHGGDVLAGTVSLDTAHGHGDADVTVASIADLDPPVTRPDVTAEALLERVRDGGPRWIAVTTAAGRLVGVVDGNALAAVARADRLP